MDIWPSFYDSFTCLAGACQHSCCKGWEIDVDEESAARYRTLQSPLGNELRSSLRKTDEGWTFALTEDDKCPFLRSDGLCRLILAEGEDFLCDTCTLHPRFFETVGEDTLYGLGLCCEETVSLLLAEKEPLLLLTEDGTSLTIWQLLQRYGCSCQEDDLHFAPIIDDKRYRQILRHYAGCEAIDGSWTEDLEKMSRSLSNLSSVRAYVEHFDPVVYNRLFAYLLYRQLERLENVPLDRLLSFVREAVDFIFLRDALTGETAESIRRWSAEIEYSTENPAYLLQNDHTA